MSDDIATQVAQKMNGDLESSGGDKWAVNGDSSLGTILVTGGAGYIGSHCCVQLLEEGFRYAGSPSRDTAAQLDYSKPSIAASPSADPPSGRVEQNLEGKG